MTKTPKTSKQAKASRRWVHSVREIEAEVDGIARKLRLDTFTPAKKEEE